MAYPLNALTTTRYLQPLDDDISGLFTPPDDTDPAFSPNYMAKARKNFLVPPPPVPAPPPARPVVPQSAPASVPQMPPPPQLAQQPQPETPAGVVPETPTADDLGTKPLNTQEKLADLKPPDPYKSNWAQRLAMAALSMTRLAPIANQIVHPIWAGQRGAYELQRKDLEQQLAEENTGATQDVLKAKQAALEAQADQREALADSYGFRGSSKEDDAQYKADLQRFGILTRGRDGYVAPADSPIPAGYDSVPYPQHAKDTSPASIFVMQKGALPLTEEMTRFIPGSKAGDLIPSSQFNNLQSMIAQGVAKSDLQADKPEAPKLAQQKILTKLANEGLVTPGTLQDTGQMIAAIKRSKTLTADEKSAAIAYMGVNPTPSSQATNMSIRVSAMEDTPVPVINTQTGQAEEITRGQFAAASRSNPGLYVSDATGQKVMKSGALFSDMYRSVNQARDAFRSLPDLDQTTRAALAEALKQDDPRSAIQSFLQGNAGQYLFTDKSPAGVARRNAVQSVAQLTEQMMALRSVAGMGQGSDDLRSAIKATLPGAKSWDKQYALDQLDKVKTVLDRLHGGIPQAGRLARRPLESFELPNGTFDLKAARAAQWTDDELRKYLSTRQ